MVTLVWSSETVFSKFLEGLVKVRSKIVKFSNL